MFAGMGGGEHGVRDGAATLGDGRSIGYAEAGDPDGTPLLYCHGVPGSRLDAELFVSARALAGVRLIAPDRPGFGNSSARPGYRLLDWPADAAALADVLAIDRFAVLGFSSGGKFALACARVIPERVAAIGAVGCVGPPGSPGFSQGYDIASRAMLALAMRSPAAAGAAVRVSAALARRFPRPFLAFARSGFSPPDRAVFDTPGYRAQTLAASLEGARQRGAGLVADAVIESSAWGFELGEVELPVRLWHGERDETVPLVQAEFLARALARGKLDVLAGRGHLVPDRYPGIVAELTRGAGAG